MRFHAALGALALAVGAFALRFLWHGGIDSLYDDSVSYLIMAQAFSPFEAVDPAIAVAAPDEKYPPLFPLLLALTGGAYDWRIAHAVVALCFAASVFLFGEHARRVTGSARLAWIAALVFAAMPGAWLSAKGILSEFPFMALVFAALVYYDRLRESASRRGAWLAMGVLLAAVMLTRTIGVALAAAVAFAECMRFLRTRDAAGLRALPWTLGVAFAITGLWYALRPGGGEDTYVTSSAGMIEGFRQHGLTWAREWIRVNASSLADAWFTALMIFWGEPWKPGFMLASAFGILGLAGALRRAARGEVDAAYCVAFLAILLLWPYPGQMYRLAFPVVPLLMLNAIWLAKALMDRRLDAVRVTRWSAAVAVLPLALCVPAVLFYIVERARMPHDTPGPYRKTDIAEFYRIPSGPSAERNALTQIAVLGDMERLRETTPREARVMWYTPNYVSLLARRRGVPLERPGDSAALAAQVRSSKADYIYLANVQPRDSLHAQGDPLDPAALAAPFSEPVWKRVNERGETLAILLKIDNQKITSHGAP
jgi:4-amino-4-deoxy-L-arabinose transferase-like glycosyltransferase